MKDLKITVNHRTGTVALAAPNSVPSTGSYVSILEVRNCPSELEGIKAVRESAILFWKINPVLDFSQLGLGKIVM